ncbi:MULTISPECIES: phage antirepressor N-terminal domain-containing protein [unclassified Mannheimia]|uniref:phage antirepressor N-terminal domain-containing protein n=1 Tax=unclassified Mannheimia TaxID=2645054 RepID=UPI00359EA16D
MSTQISTQTISFNNQALITFEQNGTHYTAMKPICENIGLTWHAQYERIKRDEILSQGILIIRTPTNGGDQQMICLPIEYINGWLFGIDVNRCKPEIRETLIKYKKECYQALHDYWFKGKAERNQVISPEQQQAIQSAVQQAHHRTGLHWQEIYRQIKVIFHVAKYDQLPADQFGNVMAFITNLQKVEQIAPLALPEKKYTFEFTEDELQSLVWAWFAFVRGIHTFRYIYPMFQKLGSNMAGEIYGQGFEYSHTAQSAHKILERITKEFDCDPMTNWRVLKHVRNFDPTFKKPTF